MLLNFSIILHFHSLYPSIISKWCSTSERKKRVLYLSCWERCACMFEKLYQQQAYYIYPFLWDHPKSSLKKDNTFTRQKFSPLFDKETTSYSVRYEICQVTAVQYKWQWSHLCLRNTDLSGLPKPGGRNKCRIFPTWTFCFIYFHTIYRNIANPVKPKWLPTVYLQFIFIPFSLISLIVSAQYCSTSWFKTGAANQ